MKEEKEKEWCMIVGDSYGGLTVTGLPGKMWFRKWK